MNSSIDIMNAACALLAILSAAYAVIVAIAVFRTIRAVPLLERLSPPEPKKWPRVSVIVAGCNEEQSIEEAMRSRLAEQYPNAEYILVDDRSTDRTGAIVDRLAAEDERVRAVHIDHLPDGWLGKVHAMHVGLEHATGEWILFSDADVHHEPGALSRIIAYCESKNIDHISLFPTVWSATFFLDVFMNAMLRVLATGGRVWKVTDPTSRVSIGGGLFNLMRRSSLERAGGLDPLKLEVVDDAALGQMLKWSGARQAVLNGRGFISLFFYRSLPEAIHGMEKNAFAMIGRFNVARFLAASAMLAIAELGSFGALVFSDGWPRILALATISVALVAQLFIARWMARPLLPTVLAPLGLLFMFFAAFRSMFLTLSRGGIDWRGTRYPLDALRRGMRLELH